MIEGRAGADVAPNAAGSASARCRIGATPGSVRTKIRWSQLLFGAQVPRAARPVEIAFPTGARPPPASWHDVPVFDTIEVAVSGIRGVLVIDRPDKLNALSPHTLREITAAARWFDEEQRDVRVVVVSGRGPAFCAGADVSAFASSEQHPHPHSDADAGRVVAEALERMEAITIARIHGWCIGGGIVLAAACDLRIAADDARFSIPEVDLGIPLAWGGIPRLVREIGPTATKELVITSREFGAGEALRLGLLNRIVPTAELDDVVEQLAATVAAKPRVAVRSTKRHVNAVRDEMTGTAASWSDADGLLAAMQDPEGRASAAAHLQRFARR